MATEPEREASPFLDVARTRRVSRAFRTDGYGDDVLHGVLEAANNAPSATNARPWEFVVIDDDDHQKELSLIYSDETKEYKRFLDPTFWGAGNSREFIDAPATVLIAGDLRYKHWWPQAPDGYRHTMFHKNMATAAVSLHLAATTAGLATTWVTTRGPTQQRLRDLLGMPDWFHVGTAAPLGFPELERTKDVKSRFPLDDKIHEGAFDRSSVPTYDEIMERKEKARESVYHPEGDAPPLEDVWGNTALTLEEFVDLTASWRPTVTFEDGMVSDASVEDALEAGRQAPSAGNAQPWEFILVRDDEGRSSVADAVREDLSYKRAVDPAYDLPDRADLVSVPPDAYEQAPLTLVVAGNRHLENLWPDVPDGSQEKLFHHSMTACITSIAYAMAAGELGTAWYAPAATGQRRLRQLLDLPDWFDVEAVMPVGLPDADSAEEPAPRATVDEKIHRNHLDVDRLPDTEALIDARP